MFVPKHVIGAKVHSGKQAMEDKSKAIPSSVGVDSPIYQADSLLQGANSMSSYLCWHIPVAQVLVNKRNTFERHTDIQRCFTKHNGRKQDEMDREKFSVCPS